MSYSRRYDSYSPRRNCSLSRSLSRSRSSSRSCDSDDVRNPGNNLYVTGLSPRITKRDLEDHFSKEGTAKWKRGRTPTPGKYLGVRPTRVRDYERWRTYSRSSDRYSSRRSQSYSP